MWTEPFTVTASIFERGIAVTNAICFLSSLVQHRGLFSSRGIAPASEAVTRMQLRDIQMWEVPTLCRWNSSDTMLLALHYIGIVGSLLAFTGIAPGVMIAVCGLCYQSLKNVAGPFLGLQMHANLVEADYLYALTSPFIAASPRPLILVQWALLSRVMLGGAVGKWTGGDRSWRDFTAMSYHYWTQPLPGPLSPYFHRLPLWVHKLESVLTFLTEGLGAVAVFSGWQTGRIFAFLCFGSILLMINVSGNFGHLGLLTMVEGITLLNDNVWLAIIGRLPFGQPVINFLLWTWHSTYCPSRLLRLDQLFSLPILNLTPYVLVVLPYMLIGLVPLNSTFGHRNPLTLLAPITDKPLRVYQSIVSIPSLKPLVSGLSLVYAEAQRWHPYAHSFDLGCRYVKFGHMTKRRWEIIVEGSSDKKNWIEYQFRNKPSDVSRFPPVLFNHIPMLEWRLWFLPNEHARGIPPPKWFVTFLKKLLEGEPAVLALMGKLPSEFEQQPPKYIRAVLYEYRFTHCAEQDETERRQAVIEQRRLNEALDEQRALIDSSDDETEESKVQSKHSTASDHAIELPSINPRDWWYRLKFVDQYGPTLGPIVRPTPAKDKDKQSVNEQECYSDDEL